MNREMLMLVDAISREKSVELDVVFDAVEAAHDLAGRRRHDLLGAGGGGGIGSPVPPSGLPGPPRPARNVEF